MPKIFSAVEQDIENKKMELLPCWPDDCWEAPNDMLQSALFGVVMRGQRIMLERFELHAGSGGWKIYYAGKRLDQIDLDILLTIVQQARNTIPGSEIRFTLRSILSKLKHRDSGGRSYAWLAGRIEDMTSGEFYFENGNKKKRTGSLFRKFVIDEITREKIVETNKDLRVFYDDITYLNITARLALGSQLSKWLHALISSHTQWMPTKVITLMDKSGSSYARLRDFRSDLRTSLQELQEHRVIQSWEIDVADLLHIQKIGTLSQQRFNWLLGRRSV